MLEAVVGRAHRLGICLGFAGLLIPGSALAGPAPAPNQSESAPAALAPGQAGPPAAETAPAEAEPETTAPETTAPDEGEQLPPVAETAAPAKQSGVDDAAWGALEGRQVEVSTADGPVKGELASHEGDTIVLVQSDGQVVTMPKAKATGVRVAQPEPAATGPAPKEEMASLDTGNESPPEDAAEEGEEEEELTKGEQRRKDRREKREHAILGAFTMHGATYSHWRGDGINAGHASYAMDWGLGANFSPSFGMYAMAGGLFGAKIDGKSTKANYGHIAALFVFGGKYYYSTIGAGGAFSRLRFEDNTLHKDRGLALPFKLVGKIPLPHKLYIGLGLTYEFAAVRGFSRFINAIGGQIVFGRW